MKINVALSRWMNEIRIVSFLFIGFFTAVFVHFWRLFKKLHLNFLKLN